MRLELRYLEAEEILGRGDTVCAAGNPASIRLLAHAPTQKPGQLAKVERQLALVIGRICLRADGVSRDARRATKPLPLRDKRPGCRALSLWPSAAAGARHFSGLNY